MKQVFKRKILTTTKTVNNILRYYYLATDKEQQNGSKWYINAKYYAYQLRQKYGFKEYQIIGVIAALSPQTNWQENKRIAELFLQGKRDNLHNRQQIYKAELCLTANEDEIFNILTKNGVKTSYFYKNIQNCVTSSGTTIDRHSLAVCTVHPESITGLTDNESRMTKRQYDYFAQCHKVASDKIGLLPHQLQAVTWTAYRRLRGLPETYKTTEL